MEPWLEDRSGRRSILGGAGQSLRGGGEIGDRWREEDGQAGPERHSVGRTGEVEGIFPYLFAGGGPLQSRVPEDFQRWASSRYQVEKMGGRCGGALDEDELSRLRERADALGVPERDLDAKDKKAKSSSSGESSRKKKEKKSRKKKKDKEKDEKGMREGNSKKIQGSKGAEVIFGSTGLDPDYSVRRKVVRKAKRIANRRRRRNPRRVRAEPQGVRATGGHWAPGCLARRPG